MLLHHISLSIHSQFIFFAISFLVYIFATIAAPSISLSLYLFHPFFLFLPLYLYLFIKLFDERTTHTVHRIFSCVVHFYDYCCCWCWSLFPSVSIIVGSFGSSSVCFLNESNIPFYSVLLFPLSSRAFHVVVFVGV